MYKRQAFSNGLYNIRDGSFKEFTPDVVITNKIPWPYNPAAHDDLLDHTLNRLACDDPEVRALLEEMVGYCMYRRNELGKAFILIGDKSNGKSCLLYTSCGFYEKRWGGSRYVKSGLPDMRITVKGIALEVELDVYKRQI